MEYADLKLEAPGLSVFVKEGDSSKGLTYILRNWKGLYMGRISVYMMTEYDLILVRVEVKASTYGDRWLVYGLFNNEQLSSFSITTEGGLAAIKYSVIQKNSLPKTYILKGNFFNKYRGYPLLKHIQKIW